MFRLRAKRRRDVAPDAAGDGFHPLSLQQHRLYPNGMVLGDVVFHPVGAEDALGCFGHDVLGPGGGAFTIARQALVMGRA
jgi:hypothetical protein